MTLSKTMNDKKSSFRVNKGHTLMVAKIKEIIGNFIKISMDRMMMKLESI